MPGRLSAMVVAVIATMAVAPAVGAAAVRHPSAISARTSVPLGSAVWYACTTPVYGGPAGLRCPVAPFDARYAATFAQSFDRATPENEFKMRWTQPSKGQFDFRAADGFAAFAAAHGKKVRGHALVYAAANPAWVDKPFFLTPWTRLSLLNVMRTHISTVVGRYKTRHPGLVTAWDVVNEPFLQSGARDPNVYQRVIGNDWIEQAFRAANAADPDALLFLNEFNADTPNARQAALYALVADFVRRGVPIDGVGLEMHVGADGSYPTLQELKAVMAQYASLGLRVEVTELDALRPVQGDPVLVQRAAYDTVARACQESANCTGVTVWGTADPYSWRGAPQMATLFTAGFGKKRAYDLLRCRLDDPRPASGAWAQRDCGPVEILPAGTTAQPTGPTQGSSPASDPRGS
ncbi:MAG: endo-1,4-beta-xylanase [Solirubrobacteraceae bacterium]